MTEPFRLIMPSKDRLPGYVAALEAGWFPDNLRGIAGTQAELARIAQDVDGWLAAQDDPEAKGPPYVAPDGTAHPRLPGYRRWLWDGEFCGFINLRWQPGTAALPPHVLGHIGFGVVPWKRGRGLAALALSALLPEARAKGLPYVEITADETNLASRRTIERCGGEIVERFVKIAAHGGADSLRYRIPL